MATSPIYNWPEPDNTDLVKNGALAMRTLGDAIDTTMATMTPKSIVDAKGDLIAASAADTPARLAVGNNGETLVADSSTATGLRWQGNYAAGKNKILNSNCSIWQRGTSISVGSASYTYTADRFKVYSANTSTTVSRDTSAPTGFNYSIKLQRPNGNTGTNSLGLVQIIESINTTDLKGQAITFSFYIKKGANYSGGNITATVLTGTGTDQGGDPYSFTGLAAPINDSSYSPTTSFVRVAYGATIPSNVNEIAISISWVPTGTAGADDAIYVTGIQLEAGAMTTFQTATGTIQGELAAASRYYQVLASGTQKFLAPASVYTAGQLDIMITYPEMRIAPSLVATSGTGYYLLIRNGGSDPFNSITLNGYTTPRGAALYNNTEISSTAGNAGWVYLDNASASVALNAEL